MGYDVLHFWSVQLLILTFIPVDLLDLNWSAGISMLEASHEMTQDFSKWPTAV